VDEFLFFFYNIYFYRKFENVYLGWGHKYTTDNINPPLPSQPFEEYPSGPEITEADDPSPQDEAQLLKAREDADPEDGGEDQDEGEDQEDEED
jgi:radial spoke head protein 4A